MTELRTNISTWRRSLADFKVEVLGPASVFLASIEGTAAMPMSWTTSRGTNEIAESPIVGNLVEKSSGLKWTEHILELEVGVDFAGFALTNCIHFLRLFRLRKESCEAKCLSP